MIQIRKPRFKMNIQFFAEPATGDEGGLDSLNSLLDGMEGDSAPEQTVEPEQEEQDTTDSSQPNAEDTAAQQNQQKAKPSQQEKLNYAFGQMRTENANLKDMLTRIAKASGIEYKDEQELITKLNETTTQGLAKQQNVPVELLQRMETLERNNLLYEQEQRKQQVIIGFQTLKNSYGLSDEQLTDFVQELNEAGKNPLLSNIDLDSTYKTMHFDEILENRVQKAVREALAKSSVADTHSTTPNSKSGRGSDGATQKINSVISLTDMLKDVTL